jgi:hypothetical protein
MSQRDMSYDLDGVFASRNQGQLVSAQASQQHIVRTPGLVPLQRTQNGFLPIGSPVGGWMDETTDLPLIGTVSNKTLLLGAAGLAAAVGLFFILKRKKA